MSDIAHGARACLRRTSAGSDSICVRAMPPGQCQQRLRQNRLKSSGPDRVGQTRAGRGGGTHRRDLRRPKGPKVSVLASSSSTCMVNSPIRFMALSVHRIALALLHLARL